MYKCSRRSLMKRSKKYYFIIIGVFLLSTFVNPFLGLTVNAADTNTNLTKALSTAPQGIDLSNGRFKMPEKDADGVAYSPAVSSKVVSATNDLPHPERVVQIVNNTGQAGGIWGDPARNNYIDTSKKQTLSMWLNTAKYRVSDTDEGDGLAFVLHNDKRGTNAISSVGNKINVGETLGVWGIGSYASSDNTNAVAATAIQHSWALEFDTYANKDSYNSLVTPTGNFPYPLYTSDNKKINDAAKTTYDSLLDDTNPLTSYDRDIAYPHLASGFPGSASTYKANPVNYFKSTDFKLNGIIFNNVFSDPETAYYYTMNHTQTDDPDINQAQAGTLLSSGAWVHLTIEINIPKGTIKYSYNDKKTDGTPTDPRWNNIITGTVKLSADDIKNLDIPSSGVDKDKLYYGFTGSTGILAMNGLVIFEQIPGFAETAVTTDFTDTSSGDSLKSSSDYAYSGDQLNLKYNLTYQDGNEAWTGVKSHIILPKNVTFTPDSDGNIGTVNVGGTAEKIPSSAITTDSDGNTVLEYALPSSMNTGDTSTASYSINGIAGNVTSDTTVASTHSRFLGDNGIADVDSPAFTIKQPEIKLTSTTDNPLTINKGSDAKINGNVSYTSGATVTNSNMLVHVTVNGGTEVKTAMLNTDPTGQLTVSIPQKELTSDTNTVRIYVTDANSKQSNKLTFIVKTKDGGLSISEYPKAASFKTVNTTRKDQVISRSGNWDLSVLDSRGSGNNWKLMANSTQLQSGSTDFNGSLIFKTGNNSYSLTGNDVQIATGQTISNDPVTTDIDSTWTGDSGVLLKSSGTNQAGTYDGTINWTLYDSI